MFFGKYHMVVILAHILDDVPLQTLNHLFYTMNAVDVQNEKSIMSDEGTTSHITTFR